jgi:hypothetical protein
LLVAAPVAQAQSAARLTKTSAAKRVHAKIVGNGGKSIKVRCRAPKRGRVVCSATYRTGTGRRCADTRVTVTGSRGRLRVSGLKGVCIAPTVAPPEVPAEVTPPPAVPMPPQDTSSAAPVLDPGSAAPSGPPPGAPGGAIEPPPGAPRAITGSETVARTAQLVGNSGFIGCTQWQVDPWYGRWWVYYCYWAYSSAPPGAHLIGWQTDYIAQVYYWTGSQAAFWFRYDWTA